MVFYFTSSEGYVLYMGVCACVGSIPFVCWVRRGLTRSDASGHPGPVCDSP